MTDFAGKRPGGRTLTEAAGPVDIATPVVQRVPGKQTLVDNTALPFGSAASPGEAKLVETAPGGVTEAAHAGTRGPTTALPYADQIQRAFGRHDVSQIQAHVGGAAREGAGAMGAEAYAYGNHVAFAGEPSLHTAAHEAAHVIQQRGGVQLKGGVGQAGDSYEQHADAVADRVVAGQSAEGLLDQMAGGGGGSPAVQRKVGFELEVNWQVKREAATEDERTKQEEEQIAFEARKQEVLQAARKQVQDQKDAEFADVDKAYQATDKAKKHAAKPKRNGKQPDSGIATESELRTQFPDFVDRIDDADPDRASITDVLPGHLSRSGMIQPAPPRKTWYGRTIKDQERRFTVRRPDPANYQAPPGNLVRNQNDNAAVQDFIPGVNIAKGKTLMEGPDHPELAPPSESSSAPSSSGPSSASGPSSVAKHALWDLTADQNSGVSQLEWVTKPLETRAQVDQAMTEITAMGTQLNTLATTASPIDAAALATAGVSFAPEFAASKLQIYPDRQRVLLADPQVTGGFRLDQLLNLMESMTGQNVTTKEDGTGTEAVQSVDTYMNKTTNPERVAMGNAVTAARAVPDVDGQPASNELKSLVALMLNYLFVGQSKLENSKGIAAGFMARTDFAHNFTLLPKRERDYFTANAGSFAALVAAASKLDMNGAVFEKGFQHAASQADEVVNYGLTRQAWCDGIASGIDLLRKSVDADNDEKGIKKDPVAKPFLADGKGGQHPDPVHFSLGRLKSVDNRVGPDNAKAAVVELRRMKGGIPVSQWKSFALNAFDLVQTTNQVTKDAAPPDTSASKPKDE